MEQISVLSYIAELHKSIIKVISDTMKSDVCSQIVQNECKISLIVDKSTFVSKKLCLILYLRTIVDNAESLQNIFLQSVKLSDRVAEVICDTVLKILENNCIDNAFVQHNLVSQGLTCIVMQEASDALSKLQTVTLFRPIRSLQCSW